MALAIRGNLKSRNCSAHSVLRTIQPNLQGILHIVFFASRKKSPFRMTLYGKGDRYVVRKRISRDDNFFNTRSMHPSPNETSSAPGEQAQYYALR
jgi:hypothetical protein